MSIQIIDGYCTTKQAADFLGLTLKALYNRHSKGLEPKPFKHGRRLLYKLADLRAWAESGEVRS
jgi:hypothetical protein